MNFLLSKLISTTFDIIQLLIIIHVVLSWIPHNPYNQWIRILNDVAEAILKPIREVIPITYLGIDFSPVIAFILLGFLKKVLLAAV